MQLCEEVADGLAARGHDITVFTSTRRDGPEIARSYPVHRLLTLDPDWYSDRSAAWQFFLGRRQREDEAVAHLTHLANSFRPQVIFIWHAIGLPRVLLQEAEKRPGIVTAYYLAGYLPELPDEYIAYWQVQPVGALARLFKRILALPALQMLESEGKPIPLSYDHVICVSEYVKQRLLSQDLISPNATVIHNGIDLELFEATASHRKFEPPISLLYAGRLEYDKGVHVILEALGALTETFKSRINHVNIVGNGEAEYMAFLKDITYRLNIQHLVRFEEPVSRDQMPQLLARFDVCVLPSALEALSRMMQEAMAMGLLVVGTATGGSSELLVNEKNGLVFNMQDTNSLVRQFEYVVSEPAGARRLATQGQRTIIDGFDIRSTVAEVEKYLTQFCSNV